MNNSQKFSIHLRGLAGKILMTTIAPVILLSLVAMFVLYNVQTLSEKMNSIINNTVPALTTSKDLIIEIRTMDLNTWKVFKLQGNPDEVQLYAFEFEDSLARFNTYLDAYMKLEMTEKAEKIRLNAQRKWVLAAPDFEIFKTLLQENKTDEALKLYESKISKYFSEIGEILSNVEINNANIIEAEEISAKELSKSVTRKSILGFSTIAVLSILVSMLVINSLMNTLSNTVNSLSLTVHELQNSSQKMNIVSEGLSSSVDSQMAGITESVTAMDEISATIKNNDQSAAEAYSLSNLTKASAESGKKTVDKMIDEMSKISSSYDDIQDNILKNGDEIKRIINVIADISKKTEVINDIVFQTKLLSFNASVEAARAGENGKGFAVVAEEVGKLAQMSGQASHDIEKMLKESQEQVQSIAENTTKNISNIVKLGREKVQTGKTVASSCLEDLNEIINCVTNLDNSINQISVAIREQSHGVDEVNKALKHLDDMTNESTEMSNNSKDASKDLAVQSQNLRASIQGLRKVLGTEKKNKVHS